MVQPKPSKTHASHSDENLICRPRDQFLEQDSLLKRQQSLVKIANKIRRSLDLETICQTATDEIRQLLTVDRVAIYRFNADWSGDFTIESVAEGWLPLVGMPQPVEDTHLMETRGGRYAHNETFAITDIYQAGHAACHIELLEAFQAKAYAIAPIFQDENLWGLLAAYQNSGPRHWSEDEVQLLAQIGEQLGIALQQAEEQAQILQRQQSLVKIANKIRRSLDLETICQTATDEIRQLLTVDRVVIYRFNADWSGDFTIESVAEGWLPLVGMPQPVEDTHLMETRGGRYAHNETFAITDIYQAGHAACHIELLEAFQAKAYAIAPIFQDENLWGLLAAYQNSGPRHWSEDEVQLLAQIGEQLGIALQQADYVVRIETQSGELKHLVEELKQSQTQLVQREKMASLGQLVAGIAHEINNPINFIHGNLDHVSNYVQDLATFLQLYQTHQQKAAPEVQELAEEIDLEFILTDLPRLIESMQRGSKRIHQIVLSLRNFSRLDESGFKAANLHEGIDSTLLVLDHRLQAGGKCPPIEIIRKYGDIPNVECYPAQINQAFMNLIVNAVDSLKVAAQQCCDRAWLPKIWIETKKVNSSQIEVRVRDNGIGIPQSIQEKIFDHFFTTKPVGQGTGLGLPITHNIVCIKHQGTLQFASTPGKGTEFVLTLPTQLTRESS